MRLGTKLRKQTTVKKQTASSFQEKENSIEVLCVLPKLSKKVLTYHTSMRRSESFTWAEIQAKFSRLFKSNL